MYKGTREYKSVGGGGKGRRMEGGGEREGGREPGNNHGLLHHSP